jgi:REP element-mobilizing transposase RayT
MGRPLRTLEAGGYYHVTTRGNGGCAIFLDDRDRKLFLRLLVEARRRGRLRLHCWCLMTTHYHLVVELREVRLSRAMQYLNGVYARRFNARHGLRDHMFGERFASAPIESEEHLHHAIAYVLENPVRAGIVASYDHWQWSGRVRVAPRPMAVREAA